MRIQHNIMAMNAYRNYNLNTIAVSKNLEKLSSGYKINRAGDDAAGLAISEKMRAQITGLDAASKNVKDGISLVKTAEGAMQEVQDMLNRMVNLATQSANGTYDNEVDRANLQKEVDQLQSEINRIADSANFNGIKLLDGSMEADTTSYTTTATKAKNLTILGTTKGTAGTPSDVGTSTIVHKDAKTPNLTEFKVELEGLMYSANKDAAATATYAKIDIGGTTVTTAIAPGTTMNGTQVAQGIYKDLLQKASDAGEDEANVEIGGVKYNVSVDGSKLVFKMDSEGAATYTPASFTGNFTVEATLNGNAASASVSGNQNMGTIVIFEGNPNMDVQLANTTTSGDGLLSLDWFTDGKALKVGDETYVFAMSEETKNANYDAGYKVIDLTDLVDPDKVVPTIKEDANVNAALTLSEIGSRITQAAKDNAMFTVGHNAVTDAATGAADTKLTLTFQEKASYNGDADLTTVNGIQKQIQFIDKVTVNENITKGKGKALTLQIGDTSESFNQLRVSIGDIHTDALGISKINIGTQEGAAAAIDTIKNAINSVSSIRGTLGATQNRLEHTQNNLSVMKENIQDAESTIRDTDIAEEMMAYTKNNILVQSAQAMLAQANQIPQGVLQLLG